jgi:hypothetical protein
VCPWYYATQLLVTFEEVLEVLIAGRSALLRLPAYQRYKRFAESVAFEVKREGDSTGSMVIVAFARREPSMRDGTQSCTEHRPRRHRRL